MNEKSDDMRPYAVISADGHAGAPIHGYREYLASDWHDEFDSWACEYVNPLEVDFGSRLISTQEHYNWDSGARESLLEAQGIVAEVLFPNTVPPFYPHTQVLVPPPPTDPREYARRWAGLQAHNRWLREFCESTPGRRAGVAQIMLNSVPDAVREVRWVSDVALTGGVLVPGVPPGADIDPLWSARYDPIWRACVEHGVVVNLHGGAGVPEFGFDATGQAIMTLETMWFSHRPLWHLIFGGVLDRFPRLRVVLTEQGAAWIPRTLRWLDAVYDRFTLSGSSSNFFGGETVKNLQLRPSDYFRRNFYLGASFLHRDEVAVRHEIGLDRIMWGADFPHVEGTYPYSKEALRAAFSGVDSAEVRAMVTMNAANVYNFSLDRLDRVAQKVGPLPDEIDNRLEEPPNDSFCYAFAANTLRHD